MQNEPLKNGQGKPTSTKSITSKTKDKKASYILKIE